jgi:hypothetical protein
MTAKYIVFGADEGSALALLARSPASYDAIKSKLSAEGLAVAAVMLGGSTADERVKRTADYFIEWAKNYTISRRRARSNDE